MGLHKSWITNFTRHCHSMISLDCMNGVVGKSLNGSHNRLGARWLLCLPALELYQHGNKASDSLHKCIVIPLQTVYTLSAVRTTTLTDLQLLSYMQRCWGIIVHASLFKLLCTFVYIVNFINQQCKYLYIVYGIMYLMMCTITSSLHITQIMMPYFNDWKFTMITKVQRTLI